MRLDLPMKPKSPLVAGAGSALMDILLTESEEFVAASGSAKGGMTLVEAAVIERMLGQTRNKPARVSGGSAGNTMVGIGKLGGPSRFIGKRGEDELGRLFEADHRGSGVDPRLFLSSTPTGRVLSVITPDAQRTMFTFLGAASELAPGEIRDDIFNGAAIVHLEGYLLFNEALMLAALAAARAAGAVISLDLASFTVVEACRATLQRIISEYVGILIANEDEARAYTGIAEEERAIERLSEEAPLAVLKIGKRGSLIRHDGRTCRIGIVGDGRAVDTTGAGDLWAAGFLYGLAHGLDIDAAGRLGAACGYEVCQVVGAHIPADGWERIHKVVAGESPAS